MTEFIERMIANPVGRLAFKTVRPLAHILRRTAHPELPISQKIARVSFRGRHFAITHRRESSDPGIIDQCFGQRQYDMPGRVHGIWIEKTYNEIVASGRKPLVIDCGANIGASALWFSARYPDAHIVAVEPAADNFSLLQKNAAGLNIALVQAGIGPEDGHAHLSEGCGTDAYRTIDAGEGPDIDIVSIRTILVKNSQYIPFLLKIDIEGAEKALFEGDTAEINRFPLIIMEPHDWLFPGQHTSRSFFAFHAAAGREFCMRNENIASIASSTCSLSS